MFGTVSGGLSAELTGGNFWQGAATGLVVSRLNHVAHRMNEPKNLQQEDPKPKVIQKSGHYGVDLTDEVFHVGDTRVDYNTSCTTIECVTTFKAFSGDGFRDPLDIGIEIGGTPYNYIPWEFSISYKNPGFVVGQNIK